MRERQNKQPAPYRPFAQNLRGVCSARPAPSVSPRMTSFELKASSGGARCGLLRFAGGEEVATPALLGYTRRGAPVHLTHDTLASLPAPARLLGVHPLTFSADAPPAACVAAAGGLGAWAGLPGCLLFASCREPYTHEAVQGGARANDAGLVVSTQAGEKRVTPAAYAQVLAALRCAACVGLADEPAATERPRRLRTACERTQRWLAELQGALSALGPPGAAAAAALWASVQGGADGEERARASAAAARAAEGQRVAGFSLGGFGCGEAPGARPALLQAAMQHLPANLPRHVAGLSAPEEVLQCVAQGVDLFDGAYGHAATSAGCALIFPVSPDEALEGRLAGSDGFKANLRAPYFRTDPQPLLPGCACFACVRHTRAYVYHLLDTHEMLAEVLLDLHNLHHMQRFFLALRDAVGQGAFPQFQAFHARRAQDARMAAALAAEEDE